MILKLNLFDPIFFIENIKKWVCRKFLTSRVAIYKILLEIEMSLVHC